jgi:hypothetical protein
MSAPRSGSAFRKHAPLFALIDWYLGTAAPRRAGDQRKARLG